MRKLKWVIEISVDSSWVAHGFNMKEFEGLKGNSAATERVKALLPWSDDGEISARVLKAPETDKIKKLQGY